MVCFEENINKQRKNQINMAGYRILYHNNDAAILHMRNYLSLALAPSTCRYVQNAPKDHVQRPKKPQNSFILFTHSIRDQLIRKEPTIKFKDIMREAAKQWSVLDSSKKLIYKQKYDEKYQQYLKDLEAYKEYKVTNKIEDPPHKPHKLHKEQKSLGKPKRPPTAYMLYFMSHWREKKSNASLPEVAKIISKEWNEMSDINREKYTEEAKRIKENYNKDLEEWEEKMIQMGRTDVIRNRTRRLHKDEISPKK